MKKIMRAAALFLSLVLTFSVTVMADEPASIPENRMTETEEIKEIKENTLNGTSWTEGILQGTDRYATGRMVANAFVKKLNKGNPDTVILVTGEKFPDALSANALAGCYECPLVLSNPTELSSETEALLKEDWAGSVKTVICVGGGFRSGNVPQELKDRCGVESVDADTYAGSTRIQTAELVRETVRQLAGSSVCIITTGNNPADALSSSSWSYAYKYPILLADNGYLNQTTLNLALQYEKVVIVGGNSAVNTSVQGQLDEHLWTVLGGATRYETSRMVSDHFLKYAAEKEGDYRNAVIASGETQNYPDALLGGPLAGLSKAPVLLTSPSGMESGMVSKLKSSLGWGSAHISIIGYAAGGSMYINLEAQLYS